MSILNIVSKVLERVNYDQFEGFLLQNKLLFEYQSGFRRGFSTDTCLTHLSDYIRFQMDKSSLTGMVLLDLQKAFDTVDHRILLMKLETIGLNADCLRWFQSYLSGRTQLVNVQGTCSSFTNVSCGVPQGSILGPLLFLIYVNDMAGAIDEKILLYADDTAILVSNKHVDVIELKLRTALETISDWLVDNKLSLHLGKTESILFGSKRKLSNCENLKVSCNGVNIEAKTSVKYLGASIDNCMSGDLMALNIIQKASCRLKFLYRNAKFLNSSIKKLLVSALIQSHFDYGCTYWFSALSCKLKAKLQTSQNKLIRFVMGTHSRSHVGTAEFKEMNWLPVEHRVAQMKLNLVYKIVNGSTPGYLQNDFNHVSQTHRYSTRHSVSSLCIPSVKSAGKASFTYSAIKLWNELPKEIKNINREHRFKAAVKSFLFDKMQQRDQSDFVYFKT